MKKKLYCKDCRIIIKNRYKNAIYCKPCSRERVDEQRNFNAMVSNIGRGILNEYKKMG